MQLSCCAVTVFEDREILERFHAIQRYGINYVELWGIKGFDIDTMEQDQQSAKWHLDLFCGTQDHRLIARDEREGFLAELRQSMAIAKRLKCPKLAVLTDVMDERARPILPDRHLSEEEKILSYYEGLKQAAEIAEQEQFELLIEPLNTKHEHPGYYLDSTAFGFEVIQAVGSPRVKLLFDIYHLQIMEGNLISSLEENLDKIGHIHVADVPGRHEPGTGEINYPNIIRMLKANNYEGVVGLECVPARDSDEAIEAYLKIFD